MENIKATVGKEEIIISTGKLAKQADGSVTVQSGGTVVLVTCVCSSLTKDGIDFFPLTVEYKEKTYAAGRIPGGFFKREGRPTEKEILTSRMIDRPIRPLFPDGMRNEVQIVANVLSYDGKTNPDILSIIGSSAALMISDIPFNGPIAGIRIGMIDGEFVINPTYEEEQKSSIDLIVVANNDSVVMLEAGANIVSEEKIIEAIKFAHEAIKPLLIAQKEFAQKVGKKKRVDISFAKVNEKVCDSVQKKAKKDIKAVLDIKNKQQRIEKLELLKNKLFDEESAVSDIVSLSDIDYAVSNVEKEILREMILIEKKRIDGRACDEIRPLSSEVNILPSTHGCGLFTRGETQALAIVTLGTSADQQRVESLQGEGVKEFMLHYNFPPFSVGETGSMRGPGRREIGHGALAEKALKPVLPSQEKFPYTIRLVSEILESNGSSSMASVCSGSLALMAGGVPVKSAVSGIAMGVIVDKNNYTILTDIAGAEDHNGDMDFKVAGTMDGVTAVQMDLKVEGVSFDVLVEAFKAAKIGRMKILNHMNQTIASPLTDISPNAPRIFSIQLPSEKIREVIGPGGKMIRKIVAESGAEINIDDNGVCQIASSNRESLDKAIDLVKGLIAEPEVGKTYNGKITKIMNFGAFCEYMPGQEGLIHVSELSSKYIKEVTEVVKEGQEVRVKLIGIDDQNRVKLSIKQAE